MRSDLWNGAEKNVWVKFFYTIVIFLFIFYGPVILFSNWD